MRAGPFHSAGTGTRRRPATAACSRRSQLCGSVAGRRSSARTGPTDSGPTLRIGGSSVRFRRVTNSTTLRSEALGDLGPRWGLGTARRARVLDGRRDHRVPDGAGQRRRVGRDQRSARLVVDAVVVAGEALDGESLEGWWRPSPTAPLAASFAQLGCGDSLASARACLPPFARLHVSAPSQCRTHFTDVRRAPRRWERALRLRCCTPSRTCRGRTTGRTTGGAVELTRVPPAGPPDSAASRAASNASAVRLSRRR